MFQNSLIIFDFLISKNHCGYEDKRVVIVGIGNSGGDVAVELGKVSKQVGSYL